MTQRLLIVHGFEGNPHGNWFDWLAHQARAAGMAVLQPALPNPQQPVAAAWQNTLDNALGTLDGDTFLVGHSLGAITLLHFLSRHQPARLGGLILAAGFAQRIERLPVLNDYIDASQPDYATLKRMVMPRHCLMASNDDHVPPELSVRLAEALDSPITWVPHGGHLMAEDGFIELPPLWAALWPMLVGQSKQTHTKTPQHENKS